ncbi:MAG: polyprenyl synthetase family protein [Pseudobdellovibrionaceae bacterium]
MNNQDRKEWVDEAIERLLDGWKLPASPGLTKLKESIAYSYQRGGKRFRPVLALLVAETFAVHPQRVLAWSMAVEMIHTYSLIHDDLPCMDNDDFRRGEPTNHKKFGETTALLAGDALLTEAFSLIAQSYKDEPDIGLQLIAMLSQAAGLFGMVGGQAIDLEFHQQKPSFSDLEQMHLMKTGALIRVSAEGSALLCGLPVEKVNLCREFGEHLGLAFQIQDDLIDAKEKLEPGSFPAVLGLEQTEKYLADLNQTALQNLADLGITHGPLKELVHYNQNRTQ